MRCSGGCGGPRRGVAGDGACVEYPCLAAAGAVAGGGGKGVNASAARFAGSVVALFPRVHDERGKGHDGIDDVGGHGVIV